MLHFQVGEDERNGVRNLRFLHCFDVTFVGKNLVWRRSNGGKIQAKKHVFVA